MPDDRRRDESHSDRHGNTNPLAPVSEAWSMQNPVRYTMIWVVVILAIFVPFSVALYKRASRN